MAMGFLLRLDEHKLDSFLRLRVPFGVKTNLFIASSANCHLQTRFAPSKIPAV